MIIVGELINASRKAVAEAIRAKDTGAIQKLATDQWEAGSQYIDVNAGVFAGGQETEYLKWLVTTVQEVVEGPCCLDSADPKAIEAALGVHKGTALLNSITLEKNRYEPMLSVIKGGNVRIVALCMSDKGMPETVAQRVGIADELVNGLLAAGMPLGDIFVDPLVQPISTNSAYGAGFLGAVETIMTNYTGIHTMCGLSNISHGMPERKLLNQTLAMMAVARGLDGLIVNPLDRRMMAGLLAAEALAGRDSYCMRYLQAYRGKKLENL